MKAKACRWPCARSTSAARRIITARYLNLDKEGNSKAVTLQELANEFGVSAERIRQIEKLAIQKMRQTLEQAHYSE